MGLPLCLLPLAALLLPLLPMLAMVAADMPGLMDGFMGTLAAAAAEWTTLLLGIWQAGAVRAEEVAVPVESGIRRMVVSILFLITVATVDALVYLKGGKVTNAMLVLV
ncbi:hypothetical protein [Desulfovibrio legallii]|uniref:hypothetical protein n=1 Tax=Desulfovibrio legallii TaxID=571438 RepID=UPI0022DF8AD8|nr:hypothetical protein [Desulfovibrio legallii]